MSGYDAAYACWMRIENPHAMKHGLTLFHSWECLQHDPVAYARVILPAPEYDARSSIETFRHEED